MRHTYHRLNERKKAIPKKVKRRKEKYDCKIEQVSINISRENSISSFYIVELRKWSLYFIAFVLIITRLDSAV